MKTLYFLFVGRGGWGQILAYREGSGDDSRSCQTDPADLQHLQTLGGANHIRHWHETGQSGGTPTIHWVARQVSKHRVMFAELISRTLFWIHRKLHNIFNLIGLVCCNYISRIISCDLYCTIIFYNCGGFVNLFLNQRISLFFPLMYRYQGNNLIPMTIFVYKVVLWSPLMLATLIIFSL